MGRGINRNFVGRKEDLKETCGKEMIERRCVSKRELIRRKRVRRKERI